MISKILLNTLKVYWLAFKRFYREQYTYQASALSFTLLLALVPLLSVVVTIVSLFPVFTKFITLAQNYIVANFLPESSTIIELHLEGFIHQAASLPLIGIVFLFVTTAMSIITIENTLNQIWQIPNQRKKYVSGLTFWIVLLLSPLLIGVSIFLSTYFFSLTWVAGAISWLSIDKLLLVMMPIIINTCIFSTIYIVVPQAKVNWRDGVSGGFIAAILFELSRIGFAFYYKISSTYELIYGVFAVIPIFLVWIYVIWVIILYGALVAHEQALQRAK